MKKYDTKYYLIFLRECDFSFLRFFLHEFFLFASVCSRIMSKHLFCCLTGIGRDDYAGFLLFIIRQKHLKGVSIFNFRTSECRNNKEFRKIKVQSGNETLPRFLPIKNCKPKE